LLEYSLQLVDGFCAQVCVPEFMTIAEDMSYNHGPMLSRELFDEFLAPYYRPLVAELKRRGIRVLVDSDGDVEPLIPWLKEVGVEGILPLERMAGVDVGNIRANHPDWLMIGAYDKTVMKNGEQAMRAEFERLMPTVRGGGFIPSVDHQTPPDVSFELYHTYLELLAEYSG
jgi:uroporphyrinogen-III decarboxylase